MIVGILTSDKKFDEFLRKTITEYGKRRCLDICILPYAALKDLLNSEEYYDILFIDDSFDHRSAVETARLVRTKNTQAALVLMSSSADKVYESFAVKAHRYLLKPVTQTIVFEALDSYRKDLFAYRIIIVKIGNAYRSISSDHIAYLEAKGKECIIHTKKDELLSGTPYAEILVQLPEEFFYQTHRSYTVNLQFIQRINEENVVLSNEAVVPLSRRRKVAFLLDYNNFVRRYNAI